jgi:hypothetical protein
LPKIQLPIAGTYLPSGAAAVQVTFVYTGTVPGDYSLPVQLLIVGGRRLRLDLTGCCKAMGFAEVHLPGTGEPGCDGSITLQPVALGDASPPLQMFTFWNSGSCEVRWRVDLSDLARLREENWMCVRDISIALLYGPRLCSMLYFIGALQTFAGTKCCSSLARVRAHVPWAALSR